MSMEKLIYDWLLIALLCGQATYWTAVAKPDFSEHLKTWIALPVWATLMWIAILAHLVFYCKKPKKRRLAYYFRSFMNEIFPLLKDTRCRHKDYFF